MRSPAPAKQAGYTPPADAVARHELRFPIEAFGATVDVVGVRRPRGRDLRECEGLGRIEANLKLIERCCHLTGKAVDDLDAVDVNALVEIIEGFSSPSSSESASASGSQAHGEGDPSPA